jgi:DNA invertase Pin-like site-specific DNA recombinase
MQNGLRLCIQKGYYMGSQAPYGYKLHSFRENKRTVHTLEIVPEEAEGVKMAFNMYANGNGAAKICHALNALGIMPRK